MISFVKRSLGVLILGVALPASAQDLALVFSNTDYRNQPDLNNGREISRMSDALEDAGFDVVSFRDKGARQVARELRGLTRRVAEADRLVVILNGHIVATDAQTWLLAPGAGRETAFDVGGSALPVSPLMDMLGEKPGGAVMVLVDAARGTRTGSGVRPGAGDAAIPNGVLMIAGPTGSVQGALQDVILVPGQAPREALSALPDLVASGFVSGVVPFLPAEVPELVETEAEGVAEEEDQRTRAEILAEAEAELRLPRDERRRIQQNLAILGFDPGGIDGLIGPGSRRAVRAWQAENDIEISGYLNRGQIELLFDQGARRSAELEAEARQRQQERDARDTAYWRDTGAGDDETGMRAYLKRYPDGLFADIARDRLADIEEARRPPVSRAERRAWEDAQTEDSLESYQAYLAEWPDGAYRTEAEVKVEELSANQLTEAEIRQLEAVERQVAGNSIARNLVENRLASLGLEPGEVDGTFDDDTRKALRRFQDTRGLEPTGYVNQPTMVRILLGN